MIHEDLFVLMLYVPVNNFSVLYWDDFLSVDKVSCFQEYNMATAVSLELAALSSQAV